MLQLLFLSQLEMNHLIRDPTAKNQHRCRAPRMTLMTNTLQLYFICAHLTEINTKMNFNFFVQDPDQIQDIEEKAQTC